MSLTDVSFVRHDGKRVGYMLGLNTHGNRIYQRYNDEKLAQQYYVGAADYGYLPPEKEFAIIQDSMSGGMGQEFWDINQPTRYYTSVGVDNRFDGNTILGPTYGTITIPQVVPTVVDDSFEIWTDENTLTNWTKTGGVSTTRGVLKFYLRDGDSYCKLTASSDGTLYTDAAWDSSYIGNYVMWSLWIATINSADSRVRIGIDDGVSTTYSDYAVSTGPTAGCWRQLWVAQRISAGATRCRFVVDYDYISHSTDIFIDNMQIGGYPKCVCEYQGYLFFSIGNTIWKLSPTGDNIYYWDQTCGEITSMCVFDDGHMYIGCGNQSLNSKGTASGIPYYYLTSPMSGAFQSTLSASVYDAYADYFLNVAGVMYKVNKPNSIYKTTDPSNSGDWSTVSTVGSASDNITDVVTDIETPYFGKEDTIYYLDTDDADYPLITDLRTLARSDNCKNMDFWHNALYVPFGTQGIVESAQGVVSWLSPAKYCTNLGQVTGQVMAITHDEEYLYAIIDNGGLVEILAGQYKMVDGSKNWVWHPIQTLPISGCEKAAVKNIYAKRLWVLPTSEVGLIYYIPVTTKYGDISNDTSYSYLTGGYDITPWYHINLKADDKVFLNLTLTTEGCDDSNYIDVYYQTYYAGIDDEWDYLGRFNESPRKTISLVDSNIGSSMIRFKRVITTSSVSTSPRVTGMDCRGIWRPSKRKLIQCVLKIGDNILNSNGTPYGSEKELRETIEEIDNYTTPVKFYDISGVERNVVVLNAVLDNVTLVKDKNPEYTYQLLMEEVNELD